MKNKGLSLLEVLGVSFIVFVVLLSIFQYTNVHSILKEASIYDDLTWEGSKAMYAFINSSRRASGVDRFSKNYVVFLTENGNYIKIYKEYEKLWLIDEKGRRLLSANVEDVKFNLSNDRRFVSMDLKLSKKGVTLFFTTGVFIR